MVTAKRSRARIIDKLISMGLVSDRKDLYKKRSKKGKSAGMSEEEPEGSDNEEEEEDESEEEVEKERENGNRREQKTENLPKQTRPGVMELDAKTKKLLNSLQQEGMAGPIVWLQNCLNRTADDREEDGISQPVPMVPLTEENEDAMENSQFQKLLKKVGVRPPANEQESFWRIPAKMSPDQLRQAADSLTVRRPAEEGSAEEAPREVDEAPVQQPEEAPGDALDQEPSMEQRAQALRALLLARKKKPAPLPANEDPPPVTVPVNAELKSDSEGSPSRKEDLSQKPVNKRSRLVDSEDEEDTAVESKDLDPMMDLQDEADSDVEESHRPTKRKRLLIDDDDD